MIKVNRDFMFLLRKFSVIFSSRAAFTMAEILLSLTIIGVVAAITLPSLLGNINERTWNTQRKALYARVSQAIGMMPHVNGYGLSDVASVTSKVSAETFLTEGLSKVLKINNICDKAHIKDCGIPENLTTMAGSTLAFPKTWVGFGSNNYAMLPDSDVAAFETQNGESVALFYNTNCQTLNNPRTSGLYIDKTICANFVYDLNGLKGPNTVGKDIGFITVINPTDSKVVAPMPITASDTRQLPFYDAVSACTTSDPESRMANFFEIFSIAFNKQIWGGVSDFYAGVNFWTPEAGITTSGEPGRQTMYLIYDCLQPLAAETQSMRFVCVKR